MNSKSKSAKEYDIAVNFMFSCDGRRGWRWMLRNGG
jgi:hypothetical protein